MCNLKIFTALFLVAFVGTAQAGAGDKRSAQINWTSYEKAQQAGDNARKLFIYFFTEKCGYCRMMENTTFKDAAVVDYLNNNYTPIRVNAGQEPRVASLFSIQGVPDLRFMTNKGESIARWPGYIESEKLISLLEYIYTDSYKEMKYSDFVKKKKESD